MVWCVWQSLMVFVKPERTQVDPRDDALGELNARYQKRIGGLARMRLSPDERQQARADLDDWYAEESRRLL